jgi:hypothetical protein
MAGDLLSNGRGLFDDHDRDYALQGLAAVSPFAAGERFPAHPESIHHPTEGWMLPVFDFDPAIGSSTAVGAVAVFRDQPLQAHQAGMPKQIRADLALFECGNAAKVLRFELGL